MAKRRANWPPKRVDFNFVKDLMESLRLMNMEERLGMQSAEEAYAGKLSLGINLPGGVPIHRPSTASSKVDGATQQIITDYPSIKVTPVRTGAGGKSKDQREQLLKEAGAYFMSRIAGEVNETLFEEAKHDCVRVGAYVYKVTFDENEWPEAPENEADLKEWRRDRKRAFPFNVQLVPAANVYVSPERSWPHKFVIEEQDRFAVDMWTSYPNWTDPEAKTMQAHSPMSKIKWLEYWDADNYIAFANGKEVFRRQNLHGVVPYVFERARRRGGMSAQSLLSGPVISELEAEARTKTAMDALWQQIVFQRLLVKKDEVAALRKAWNLGPSALLPVENVDGPEKSAAWLPMPQLNAAMFQFLPLIMDSIKQATFDEALTGSRPTGVDFAAHQALLIGQGRQSLRPFVTAMNRGTSNLLNLILMIIDNMLDDDLELDNGKMLTQKLIDGHYGLKMEFEPADLDDDDRRQTQGINVLQNGILPWEIVLRDYFKRPDARGDMVQKMAEDVVKQLIASGQVLNAVMTTTNLEDAESQLQGEIQGLSEQITSGGAPLGGGERELPSGAGSVGAGQGGLADAAGGF